MCAILKILVTGEIVTFLVWQQKRADAGSNVLLYTLVCQSIYHVSTLDNEQAIQWNGQSLILWCCAACHLNDCVIKRPYYGPIMTCRGVCTNVKFKDVIPV